MWVIAGASLIADRICVPAFTQPLSPSSSSPAFNSSYRSPSVAPRYSAQRLQDSRLSYSVFPQGGNYSLAMRRDAAATPPPPYSASPQVTTSYRRQTARVPPSPHKYKCAMCDASFVIHEEYTVHILSHYGDFDNFPRCPHCHLPFKTQDIIKLHMEIDECGPS